MTISKRIADGAIMDFRALAIVLWDSAELLKSGQQYEKDIAKKKLEVIKSDINGIRGDEGLFIEALQAYYKFNQDEINEIKLSKFDQYVKTIEDGELDAAINALKILDGKLEKKLNDYFSPRRFEGAYL